MHLKIDPPCLRGLAVSVSRDAAGAKREVVRFINDHLDISLELLGVCCCWDISPQGHQPASSRASPGGRGRGHPGVAGCTSSSRAPIAF
jgi:hypothetical protein